MTASTQPWDSGHSHPGGLDHLYSATPPPWDIGRPQAAFRALADSGAITGAVVDIGCGTGEHALMAARSGHPTIGIDLSAEAIRLADVKRAAQPSLNLRFRCHNAFAVADLGESFDTVLDSGLFHIFDSDLRDDYADCLASVVRPGGHLLMLGISDKQPPGRWGPHRLTRTDIASAFDRGWHVDSIEPAVLEIIAEPDGLAAWLAVISRK